MDELRSEGTPMDRFIMDEPIDLNEAEATRDQLRAIPEIGEGRADAILAWRAEHGRFEAVEDLQHVPNVGIEGMTRVRSHFRV